MRAIVLWLVGALCLGGATARCARQGWDRLSRAPRAAIHATTLEATLGANLTAPRASPFADEHALRLYLDGEYEKAATHACNQANEAEWNYNVDLTNPAKTEAYNQATLALATFTQQQWEQKFRDVDETQIKDAQLRRQVHFLKSLGTAALSAEKYSLLNARLLAMQTQYSTAKVCPYKKQNCDLATEGLNLDPGIEAVITTSRDYDELLYIWKGWHDASGKLMRADYKEYVELSNEAAKANGFADMGAMWQSTYEVDDFKNAIDKLWMQVAPLYKELHTYTLNRLKKQYPDKIASDSKLIPGHVLGNMWGQTWINLYDLLVPYPDASSYDVTGALQEQKYTPKKMFEAADDFYQSLGLLPNGMCYGDKALIEKPTDGREVTCHASAWDFCDGKDFRIKMCTKINQDDFRTIHHEMGHIQYYQQYAHLPYVLRDGANPGFHEAIGDTIALSVDTPKHLQAVSLLSGYADTRESRVNALMKMALEKVAFMPFGLLVDMWRWDVFSGATKESEWNKHWWELKEQYQLLSPPLQRSEDDFDPGAKYHVPADSKYISYFVAGVLEFQFYRALCIEAGQYDPQNADAAPLHTCDFYKSKAAGKKLAAGLSLGSSVHWTETMLAMTNGTEMSGEAMLEYFAPLYEFLKEANGGKSAAASVAPALLLSLLSAMLALCL